MKNDSTFYDNLINSYIDSDSKTESDFLPSFIYNKTDRNDIKQVKDTIIDNLRKCDEFIFSVAFITAGGLAILKEYLKELEKKGIKGKILTTNYLWFTDPKALRDISQFKNIELRMFYIDENNKTGFHTKGYIFRFNENYKAIIGSSNLTQYALTVNNEWNNLIVSTKHGTVIKDILSDFDRIWKSSAPIDKIIDKYEENYVVEYKKRNFEKEPTVHIFKPNPMQIAVMNELNKLIDNGERRGLLISATGTGKTYASAFAVSSISKFKVKKLLFITHRETILNQAKQTFENIFGNKIKTAVLSGNNKDISGANFIFATVNMIREKKVYESFSKNEFDFMIIDEVHKVGDNLYQNIINYFEPKFLMGMSATPDRSDHYDLYQLFDHNIIYEVRLQDALEARMLCPFHYYGISDVTVNGESIGDTSDVTLLTCKERVDKIIEESKFYGYSGDRLKCLVFVNSIEVGKKLSKLLNGRGLKTRFLDGGDSQELRNQSIDQLEEDDTNKPYLDMLLAVDIFNEGVDIPSINQVILLRPTESSIIFLQQIGRGLRLYPDKEFVVIIDFIGNYSNNYYKPLSIGVSNKSDLVKTTLNPIIVGPSTMVFDSITTKRIIDSIEKVNLSQSKNVFNQYEDVKNRCGQIPNLIDFEKNGKLSSRVFMDYKIFNSYYDFLIKKDNDYKGVISKIQSRELEFISSAIGNGLRITEPLLLRCLLDGKDEKYFANIMNEKGLLFDDDVRNSIISILNFSFFDKKGLKDRPYSLIDVYNGEIKLSKEFYNDYQNADFKAMVDMILEYSIYENKVGFAGDFDNKMLFKRYEKYTRKDVARLINNTRNDESTMYGYMVYEKLNCVPIFITYSKELDELSTINYEDKFIDNSNLTYFSKSNRTLDSLDMKQFKNINDSNGKLLLFIKKANFKNAAKNKEDSSFYFLGDCKIDYSKGYEPKNTFMKDGKTKIVKMILHLDKPVKDDIYRYLTLNIKTDD